MQDIREILKEYKDPQDGVFYFLPDNLNDRIKEIEVATYSFRADKFDEEKILRGGFSEMALFRPIIDKGTDNTIFLELGGGDGRFALQLMKRGFTCVETDIAPGSVRKAREFALKSGVADTNYFMTLDAENLPFKDGSFDGVFMVAALHHLPNIDKALAEIFRVTKPGGSILILREPASWAYYLLYPLKIVLRGIIRRRNGNEPKSLADDLTFGFSKRQLRKTFARHGFSGIEISPVEYLAKFYKNFCYVKAKILKKDYSQNEKAAVVLKNIDALIAKIPVLKEFSWDWDSVMTRD